MAKKLLYILPFLLIGIYFFKDSCKKSLPNKQEISFKNFKINWPDTLETGSTKSIAITEAIAENCQIYVSNSWGNYCIFASEINKKKAFILPDTVTKYAGEIGLTLSCNGNIITHHAYEIKALKPATPLESYLGSKSITADNGVHWSMITAIPLDKFGNQTSDSTKVAFNFIRPNGDLTTKIKFTKYGVAFEKIASGKKVGKTLVGVRTNTSISKEKELLEMPSFPTSISINGDKVINFADSRQFFKISTNEMHDTYGNTVSDGTIVTLQITDPDSTVRILKSYSINGKADFKVQNPKTKGNLVAIAKVAGCVESKPLQIPFNAILKDFKISYNETAEKLILGPFVGTLGQNISDGSEVEIKIFPTKTIKTAMIKYGFATSDLGDLKPGNYLLEIGFSGVMKVYFIHIKNKKHYNAK